MNNSKKEDIKEKNKNERQKLKQKSHHKGSLTESDGLVKNLPKITKSNEQKKNKDEILKAKTLITTVDTQSLIQPVANDPDTESSISCTLRRNSRDGEVGGQME